jgi:hypothetical protein
MTRKLSVSLCVFRAPSSDFEIVGFKSSLLSPKSYGFLRVCFDGNFFSNSKSSNCMLSIWLSCDAKSVFRSLFVLSKEKIEPFREIIFNLKIMYTLTQIAIVTEFCFPM